MQLSITTDYGIRAVMCLLERRSVVTSHELSEKMGIPKNYVLKVARKLIDAGMVESIQGVRGGLQITERGKRATLWEIIRIMEATVAINKCLESEDSCSRCAESVCPVRKAYGMIQEILEENLSAVSIAALLEEEPEEEERAAKRLG